MTSNNRILCSTGTMVGHENDFNFRRAIDVLKSLREKGIIHGGELMMLKFYYNKKDEVVNCIKSSGVPFPVIHCEKGVGTDLSHAAFLESIKDFSGADELLESTFETFRLNCSFGEAVGAKKMVLHLWGGEDSDSHIEYNCDKLSELFAVAASHGIRLLVENVPSTTHDPLSNWRRALDSHPGCGLIFDTRFATLHDQVQETLTDPLVKFNLCHVHVSDFVGGYRNFASLSPIPHPLDGVVDFDLITKLLFDMGYNDTITLESPVINGMDLDVERLERSLKFIAERF
ncbi:MAG: sugar phosphate isomerase/epimerase [Clostridia bacterium]|nr:sugar phosphate isomerase/epimerase [Clostridia bacterium]